MGSGIVSCIVFPPRNSAGRGLVNSEVIGYLGEGIGAGSRRFDERLGSAAGRSRSFWAFPRASNGLPGLNVPESETGFQHWAERVWGPLPDPSRLAVVRPAMGGAGALPGRFVQPDAQAHWQFRPLCSRTRRSR